MLFRDVASLTQSQGVEARPTGNYAKGLAMKRLLASLRSLDRRPNSIDFAIVALGISAATIGILGKIGLF